jgi:predicted ATPase
VEFIYNSNNIEGSKIPRKEIEKIMQNKKLAYKVKNEVIEVQNSIKSWHFLQKNFIWNEANIKKLYHMLTKNLLQETGIPYPR